MRSDDGTPRLFGRLRFDTAFYLLLALSTVFRMVYAGSISMSGDELLHWQWSRHLDLGYPEHPPMIAWLIALSTALFGTSGGSVRLVSVLAFSGVFWIAFRLGRELFDSRAAFFGVAPMMATAGYNVGGVLAHTDALLTFFWILTVYGVKRAVLDGRRGAWLAAGLAGGLCMLSKLPATFLLPATLLFLAATREGRPWLRRWEPWAAALLSLAMFTPPLIWNARHDFFTISMRVGHQAAEGFTLAYLGELLGAQMLLFSPLLFPWLLWALGACWRRRADPRAALLGSYMAVPFLFYTGYSLFARAGVHWPAIAYVTGFVAAGAFTASASRPRSRGALLALATAPAVLLTAVLFTIPVIPDKLAAWSWEYGLAPAKVSTRRVLMWVFDWRQVGDVVQEMRDGGAGDEFVLCRRGYGVANMVAFYTPDRPRVYIWERLERNGVSYDMWRDEDEPSLIGGNAVIVADDWELDWLERASAAFREVSEPRRLEIRSGGEIVRELYLVYGTGFLGFPDETRHPDTERGS